MLGKSLDSIKRMVANMLDFYGVANIEESMEIRSPEMVDILASIGDQAEPDIGIKLLGRKPRPSEFFGVLNIQSLKYVIFLSPSALISDVKEKLPATASLIEKDVFVLPMPADGNNELEDKIRELTGNSGRDEYFKAEGSEVNRFALESQELDKFSDQIASQGLSVETAKHLMYQAAVGGLNIEFGKRIRQLGNMITRRNENLSREAIFLEALGILRESEKSHPNSLSEEHTLYLTLNQDENTTKLANQIIIEFIEARKNRILDVLYSYPNQFSFVALVGSIGIFAPKQSLPPESSTAFPIGVARTTFEFENTFLVESIREIVNVTDISTTEWNRINTLASYPEISTLLHQFFERFEKIGIGVKGHRGIRRIYLPVTHIARILGLASFKDSYNHSELRKFVIWDTILNHRTYMHNWQDRLSSLGLGKDDITRALSVTMGKKITSGLLPDGSYMPFAVYNIHAFRSYCIERMRESASAILDINW